MALQLDVAANATEHASSGTSDGELNVVLGLKNLPSPVTVTVTAELEGSDYPAERPSVNASLGGAGFAAWVGQAFTYVIPAGSSANSTAQFLIHYVQDSKDLGDGRLNVTVNTSSVAAGFDGLEATAVVTLLDVDDQSYYIKTASGSATSVFEKSKTIPFADGTAELKFELRHEPPDVKSYSLEPADSLSADTLWFGPGNWSVAQTVTFTAQDDSSTDDVTIEVNATGGPSAATGLNDEVLRFNITQTANDGCDYFSSITAALSVTEDDSVSGGDTTISFTLTDQPMTNSMTAGTLKLKDEVTSDPVDFSSSVNVAVALPRGTPPASGGVNNLRAEDYPSSKVYWTHKKIVWDGSFGSQAVHAHPNVNADMVCWVTNFIVTDSDTSPTLSITPSPSGTSLENSQATYSVSLSTALEAGNTADVSLGYGGHKVTHTFQNSDGTSGKDFVFDFSNIDTVYTSSTVTGNFVVEVDTPSQYDASPLTFVLSVDDNDDAPIQVTWPSDWTVNETGQVEIKFQLLPGPPSHDVTIDWGFGTSKVTASMTGNSFVVPVGSWDTERTLTVTANDDTDTADYETSFEFTQITSSDSKYNNKNPPAGQYTLTALNTDAPLVEITPTSVTVTEGSGDEIVLNIVLNSRPADDVTVEFYLRPGGAVALGALAQSSFTDISNYSVTFTAADWNTAQQVTVGAVDDAIDDGTVEDVTEVYVVSNDAKWDTGYIEGTNVFNTRSSIVTITTLDDADAAGLAVRPDTGSPVEINECGAGVINKTVVKLQSEPTEDVTVSYTLPSTPAGNAEQAALTDNVAGACPTCAACPVCSSGSLTFTAGDWNVDKTVTITGLDDYMDDGDFSTRVTFQATSRDAGYAGMVENVDFTIYDNGDTAGLRVTPDAITFDERPQVVPIEGALTARPLSENVTVIISGLVESEAALSTTQLVFTHDDWAPKTVYITSVNDFEVDDDATFNLLFVASSAESNFAAQANAAVTTRNRNTDYEFDMDPKDGFKEGQELRLQLRTVHYDPTDNATTYVDYFNVSDAGSLEVRTFPYSSTHDADCGAYATHAAAYASRTEFGIPSGAAGALVGTAYITIPAAPNASDFVVCFKHTMQNEQAVIHSAKNGQWQMFYPRGTAAGFRLRSDAADLYYVLPDPSRGQYAIMQVLAEHATWNFTHPASTCATNIEHCRGADNIKIVPAGAPCTYEYQAAAADYYGLGSVNGTGWWDSLAAQGLQEGATAGGVGVFGTASANPFLDSWGEPGSYFSAGGENVTAEVNGTNVTSQTNDSYPPAYAYLRVPNTAGDYDVCYSNFQRRAELKAGTHSLPDISGWMKLRRCANVAACGAEAYTLSFTAAAEPVGWTMADLSPGTYGHISFDDSGAGQLDNSPAINYPSPAVADIAPTNESNSNDYWAPGGGDVFKLIPVGAANETAPASTRSAATKAQVGSTADAGCWDAAYETPTDFSGEAVGGWLGPNVSRPLGSQDLVGSPTAAAYASATAAWRLASFGFDVDASYDNATENTGGLESTFSTVYLPANASEWLVCYRRTCNADGATCAKHSGWRVLPWHYSQRGATPPYWFHLEDNYTPGLAGTASHVLSPGYYEAGANPVPLELTWYAQVSGLYEESWAPIVVETREGNATAEPRTFSTYASNYHRVTATTDRVGDSVGTALRVVPASAPCDYTQFHTDVSENRAAEALDGGNPECLGAGAFTDASCNGASSDEASARIAAFYVRLPVSTATYSVCVREGYRNWRKINATADGEGADDNSTTLYTRDNTTTYPANELAPAPQADLTLNTFDEDRSGYEALFAVHDALGRLASADENGDVLRIVQADQDCGIYPSTWDPKLADLRPGLICPTAGAGTLAESGILCAANGTENPDLTNTTLYANANDVLDAWVRYAPPVFDDIAPAIAEFTGRSDAAGGLRLPHMWGDGSAAHHSMFKVCYRLAGALSWFQWPLTVRDAAAQRVVVTPSKAERLVAGEHKKFTAAFDAAEYPSANITFYAKLVPFAPQYPSVGTNLTDSVVNKYCQAAAPGDTEGELGAAATTVYTLTSNSTLDFSLTVPHAPGKYALCLKLDSTASWVRPVPDDCGLDRLCEYSYDAVDGGVRWFVMPGEQPVNHGLAVVNFVRCTPSDGACSTELNTDVFDTDPLGDAAKIVAASDHCNADSPHVDAARPGGATDLGPADGPSDVAEVKINLPGAAADVETRYKVCVRTAVDQAGVPKAARWLEVPQANVTGQMTLSQGGKSAFVTAAGVIKSWDVASALNPANSLLTGVAQGDVALAGAASKYVSNPALASGTPAIASAFTFNTYADVPSGMRAGDDEFKLVLAKRPATRLPESQANPGDWGDVAGWELLDSDCYSPPVDSSSKSPRCAGAACPTIDPIASTFATTEMSVHMHFPSDTGAYYVCFKRAHADGEAPHPWQLIPSDAGGAMVHTHPSFLEMAVSATRDNVVLTDTRGYFDAAGVGQPAGTWCTVSGDQGGVDCSRQRFATDLLTIAAGEEVCGAPTVAPAGSAAGPPEWYQLELISNTSLLVAATWSQAADQFVMPPASAANSTVGQYKVCLYKAAAAAGDWAMANSTVARAGIVYQLFNQGPSMYGGGSGYWAEAERGVARLTVTHSLAGTFNASERFVEYADGVEAAIGGVPDSDVTDASGIVSRVPVLDSGATVDYIVQAENADGYLVPYGSLMVEAMRCPQADAWSALACTSPLAAGAADSFTVQNTNGVCGAAGDQYGWSPEGLKQHTTNGFVTFSLQYRSACPDGPFGCGVVFSGTGVDIDTPETLRSAPQYVNVRTHVPDGVLVSGQRVAAAAPGTAGSGSGCAASDEAVLACYMRTCMSGMECAIHLQATYLGPLEFAPSGTIAVGYSTTDYDDGAAFPAAAAAAFSGVSGLVSVQRWEHGGVVEVPLKATLKGGLEEGELYLNATFGTTWTRLVVKVVRPQPAAGVVASIEPLDVALGLTTAVHRSPAPLPIITGGKVAAGTYIEALVPYEITIALTDAAGAALPQTQGALTGWTVTAAVKDADGSALVLTATAAAEDNLATAPDLLVPFTKAFGDGEKEATLVARVYTAGSACSRFATDGGCTLAFTFARDGKTSVVAEVVAAVRVPASTLQIQAAASGTVREGVEVTGMPGTYVTHATTGATTFVTDEFHYGGVFALIDGPAPNDGITSRDGAGMLADAAAQTGCFRDGAAGCEIPTYAPVEVAGAWQARWTLRADRPCYKCSFTFHTTWGAGPASHAATHHAVAEVTFTEEPLALVCTQNTDAVVMTRYEGSAVAEVTLTVVAGVSGVDGANALYPRAWAFTHTSDDAVFELVNGEDGVDAEGLAVSQDGATGLLTAQMIGGVATFADVSITAPADNETATWKMKNTFSASVAKYQSTVPGSAAPTSQELLTCTSEVWFSRPAPAVPTPAVASIQLTSVNGAAQTACPEDDVACSAAHTYWTDIAGLAAGVTFRVRFDAARNVTLAPKSPGSTPSYPSGPTWVVDGTASVTIGSTHRADETGVYSYGSLDAGVTRSGAGVDATVTLTYAVDAEYREPVREAVFALCAAGDGGVGVDTAACVDVRLWVVPSEGEVVQRAVALLSEPSEDTVEAGGTGTCGGEGFSFEALAYVTTGSSPAGTRYVDYWTSVQYTLTAPHPLLLAGAVTAATTVSVHTAAWPSASPHTHALMIADLAATFEVYSPTAAANVTLTFVGVVGGAGIGGVETGTKYSWTAPVPTIDAWRVSENVTYDTECPSRRRLMTSTHNYRTYGTGVPGAGWRYGAAPVAVGLPFPVETVVSSGNDTLPWGDRARGFTDGTLVKVTKYGWGGCNNGGAMTVHSLAPAAQDSALLQGTLAGSFIAAAGNAVPTFMGVATAWPVFAESCEACTLQLELCYTGADADGCRASMGVGSADPSDQLLLYAERLKTTKPFAVRPFRADALQVASQTLPELEHTVGEVLSAQFEKVQVFENDWAMIEPDAKSWTAAVFVRTVSVAAAFDARSYANGGFLVSAGTRTSAACSVTAAEFAQGGGTPFGTRLSLTAGQVGSFYFSRPCRACEVHVDYTLYPNVAGYTTAVSGSFPLRSYDASHPGGALAFDVSTCGAQWMLTNPPVAVRKRSPFAMTAFRVDLHGQRDVSNRDDGRTASSGSDAQGANDMGNGGGGRLWMSSPPGRARGGAAMARMEYTRACFSCTVSFAGKAQRVTVLTDPTRIIAAPRDRSHVKHGDNASWTFDLYTADAMGDRAYTVAGPTSAAHQPLYSTARTGAAALSVAGGSPAAVTVHGGLTLTEGTPAVTLTDGTKVYNGIPVPYLAGEGGAVGTATVRLDAPALNVELLFSVAGHPALPTSLGGGPFAPRVSLSVPPTVLVVEDLSDSVCLGGPCHFDVFAATPVGDALLGPAAATFGTPFSATDAADAAWQVSATASCAAATEGAVCEWDAPTVAASASGYWRFALNVRAAGAAQCTCNVTVAAGDGTGAEPLPQSFLLTYESRELSTWRWTSSANFAARQSDGATATAFAVKNTEVTLALQAWDASGTVTSVSDDREVATDVVIGPGGLDPVGCFVCTNGVPDTSDPTKVTCPAKRRGAVVSIPGHFPSAGSSGACTIAGSAVNVPSASGEGTESPVAVLVVTVEVPSSVRLIDIDAGSLSGKLLDGTPAAVAGVGSSVTLEVLNADGDVLLGDYHTTFDVAATSESAASWPGQRSATAVGGVATIPLVSPFPTRFGCNETAGGAACEHGPWSFVITSRLARVNEDVPFNSSSEAGPLYFVRRAAALSAAVAADDGVVDLSADAPGPAWRWQYGRPLPPISVFARDYTGEVVTEVDDLGAAAEVVFQAAAPPCLNVDTASGGTWVEGTCITGGRCTAEHIGDLPVCSLRSSGWTAPEGGRNRIVLEGGGAELSALTYGEAVASAPGFTRFFLSTEGFDYDSAALESPAARVFPFAIDFQQTAGLTLAQEQSNAVSCDPVPEAGGGVACRTSDSYSLAPKVSVTYTVTVVDRQTVPILSDTDTMVTLRAQCVSSATSAAVLLWRGSVPLEGVSVPVTNGVARVDGISFSGTCDAMRLTFGCTGAYCNNAQTTLDVDVRYVDPAQTAPPASTEVSVRCLSLGDPAGKSLAEYADVADDFERAVATFLDQTVVGSTGLDYSASLELLCILDAGECISEETKTDPAVCLDFSITPVPPTPVPPIGNGTTGGGEGTAPLRRFVALQEGGASWVQTEFRVSFNAPVDIGATLQQLFVEDLDSTASILRANELFEDASAANVVVQDDSEAPPTPEPATTTPTPTTPGPAATPGPPPTPTPPTPAPPPATAQPPTPTPPPTTGIPPPSTPTPTLPPVNTPAGTVAPSLALTLLLAVALVMLV
eukprot:TRINITY_DN9068_c0_g2_i1.p1 TRINITY_DN9068_c0_g2~~TRINITY_DN9068_c0_g2_i1.p1  ORF type:complete len:5365 (+),score=1212.09 TRINITY_DN9068_c0_g2_i1:65-16096(+)